jgi:RNA polymerase sigma factor (sigma-70 family)
MTPAPPPGPQAFERLLAWLSEDRERAGEHYERIRARLVRLFAARGCTQPEDLADATIDRVASKVGQVAPGYVGAPEAYFYRVAHFIFHEHLRRQRRRPLLPAPEAPQEREGEARCLDACLARLSPDDRELVRAYYRDDKQQRIERRRELAAALGIGLNPLRIRLFRLRRELRRCLEECLGGLDR